MKQRKLHRRTLPLIEQRCIGNIFSTIDVATRRAVETSFRMRKWNDSVISFGFLRLQSAWHAICHRSNILPPFFFFFSSSILFIFFLPTHLNPSFLYFIFSYFLLWPFSFSLLFLFSSLFFTFFLFSLLFWTLHSFYLSPFLFLTLLLFLSLIFP